MNYKFLYADYNATQKEIDFYESVGIVHNDKGVVASSFRGGLLSGCNLRTLFITNINSEFQLQNEDYRMQRLFIFSADSYFGVLDVYRYGEYTQVLLTPDGISDNIIQEIIKAARADFNKLVNTPPVGVLDTAQWRKRLDKPVGQAGKNLRHKIS